MDENRCQIELSGNRSGARRKQEGRVRPLFVPSLFACVLLGAVVGGCVPEFNSWIYYFL